MPLRGPTHRERFVQAIEACVSLIQEPAHREKVLSHLAQLRAGSGNAEAALVKKLAAFVRRVRTIDGAEAQRLFTLFERNGDRWPE